MLRATTAELTVTGRDAAAAAAAAFQKLRAEFDRVVTGNLSLGSTPPGSRPSRRRNCSRARPMPGDPRPTLAMPDVRSGYRRWWWDAYGWYITRRRRTTRSGTGLYADDFLPDDAIAAIVDVVGRFPGVDHPRPQWRRDPVRLGGRGGERRRFPTPRPTCIARRRSWVEMKSGGAPAAQPAPTGSPASIPPTSGTGWFSCGRACCRTSGRCYQNFQDPELPDWANAYYGDNLGVSGLKGRVGPRRVFDHDQGIPTALKRSASQFRYGFDVGSSKGRLWALPGLPRSRDGVRPHAGDGAAGARSRFSAAVRRVRRRHPEQHLRPLDHHPRNAPRPPSGVSPTSITP